MRINNRTKCLLPSTYKLHLKTAVGGSVALVVSGDMSWSIKRYKLGSLGHGEPLDWLGCLMPNKMFKKVLLVYAFR